MAVSFGAGLVVLGYLVSGQGNPGGKDSAIALEIRQADEAYVKARNARDFKTLGEQWTLRGELEEDGKTVRGREGIVAFVKEFARVHPTSRMSLVVEEVKPLGDALAQVTGKIRMTESELDRARWYTCRFESLRVKEEGVWRIAKSKVEQVPDASLNDLTWLEGNWKAADKATGQEVRAAFEKTHGGKLMLGRMETTGKDGKKVEVLQVLQADPREGVIRCWLFESTGGRAEGIMEHDGATFNTNLEGVPPAALLGDRAQSVQVLTPTGAEGFTWHVIERVIDGARVPDQKPLLFKKVGNR